MCIYGWHHHLCGSDNRALSYWSTQSNRWHSITILRLTVFRSLPKGDLKFCWLLHWSCYFLPEYSARQLPAELAVITESFERNSIVSGFTLTVKATTVIMACWPIPIVLVGAFYLQSSLYMVVLSTERDKCCFRPLLTQPLTHELNTYRVSSILTSSSMSRCCFVVELNGVNI